MSPTAQNTAIFQACGWERCEDGKRWKSPYARAYFTWRRPNGSGNYFYSNTVTDYDDLNAMHQAEEVFQNDEVLWDTYRRDIIRQVHPHVHYMHATAAQRREAFLRTLGLWDDSK